MHTLRYWLLILAAFAVASNIPSIAAGRCPHLGSERAALYQHSAFAHGYIHGYEEGFHLGNQDLQLARGARDVSKSDSYRQATVDYRPEFGGREAFRAGYRDGLVVGYTDAFSGHSFRAIDEARIAAARLSSNDPAPDVHHKTRYFELGFMDGYRAGAMQGIGDGRNNVNYRPQQAECSSARDGVSLSEEYCIGYLRGFSFGYSDGYINHDQLAVMNKDARQVVVTAARK